MRTRHLIRLGDLGLCHNVLCCPIPNCRRKSVPIGSFSFAQAITKFVQFPIPWKIPYLLVPAYSKRTQYLVQNKTKQGVRECRTEIASSRSLCTYKILGSAPLPPFQSCGTRVWLVLCCWTTICCVYDSATFVGRAFGPILASLVSKGLDELGTTGVVFFTEKIPCITGD